MRSRIILATVVVAIVGLLAWSGCGGVDIDDSRSGIATEQVSNKTQASGPVHIAKLSCDNGKCCDFNYCCFGCPDGTSGDTWWKQCTGNCYVRG